MSRDDLDQRPAPSTAMTAEREALECIADHDPDRPGLRYDSERQLIDSMVGIARQAIDGLALSAAPVSAPPGSMILPISDSGNFVVGLIDKSTIEQMDGQLPEFGVIIWYENQDTARHVFQTVSSAHWDAMPRNDENSGGQRS
ncbi:hypothetical protein AB8A05_03955 [Tardiphaga sp. 538_B7_N1_4]|uniref:hypothetical protein n=1 Tax=Tardiphaga sp. 538_B7_N1_4 TaxID=3240778 RepID=UPI003F2154EA